MGTRHLIAVVEDEQYKVAQYGQWDGYPDGQGIAVLGFLSEPNNIKKLKEALKRVRFLDHEGVDKEFVESYNKNVPEWSNQPDNRTPKQKRWWKIFQHRNLGADILSNIISVKDKEILLTNRVAFAGDSLFCEYAYIIDLDKETFEIYEGFNKEPLSGDERFKDAPKEDSSEYYPIKLWKSFDLNALPSKETFLWELRDEEE
jgi:hypothetical protein